MTINGSATGFPALESYKDVIAEGGRFSDDMVVHYSKEMPFQLLVTSDGRSYRLYFFLSLLELCYKLLTYFSIQMDLR